ncbi:hypothetical protein DIPPA_19228 [Diplonema papillatum]|nr:hypothetical protein DIPPA_19228 [Diplonema papillatum]KAJ9443981.1 hypothetical protein DIPPA_19228 [Diplonema papillatum]
MVDPVDTVCATAFAVARNLLAIGEGETVEIDATAGDAFAADFYRLVCRVKSLSIDCRAPTLLPLTLLSLHCSEENSSRVEFAEGVLKEALGCMHVPELVVEAGTSVLLLASKRRLAFAPQESGGEVAVKPLRTAYGFPNELLWTVADRFLTLASRKQPTGRSPFFAHLVDRVSGIIPLLPVHLQWGCASRCLDLLPQFPGLRQRPVRVKILVTSLDRLLKLLLHYAEQRFESGDQSTPSFTRELGTLERLPAWKKQAHREELVYCLSSAVMLLRSSIPNSQTLAGVAKLAAWTALGNEVVSLCNVAFTWQGKSDCVAPLNRVLMCALKVHTEGLEALPQDSCFLPALLRSHAETQKKLCQIIINGEIGAACRTVTKVGLLCTATKLLPSKDPWRDGDIEKKLLTKLSQGCSQYMVDERETLSLALFDSLLSFSAMRGGAMWRQCDASLEALLRDVKKSATAVQVLMFVKYKLDNIRRLSAARQVQHPDDETPLTAPQLSTCGVPPFSGDHPALHYDLSPSDLSLHLECNSAFTEMRSLHSSLSEQRRSVSSHGASDVRSHVTACSSPDDPIQVLTAYTWEAGTVEISLSVSNASPVTLKGLQVTIGCKGDMLSLFTPKTSVFKLPTGDAAAHDRVRVHSRSDNIPELQPGATVELVRTFVIASLTPGMGFNTLIDLKVDKSDDDLQLLDPDAAGGTCRLHQDFVPLRLEHFLTARHPLSVMAASDANELMSCLTTSRRLHTLHPGGDIAAIRRRIQTVLHDTPFTNISPEYDGRKDGAEGPADSLNMLFVCGLRGVSGASTADVFSLTVAALSMPGSCSPGSTEGALMGTIQPLGDAALVLSWLFQGSGGLAAECVVRHPEFPEFFARVAGLRHGAADGPANPNQAAARQPGSGLGLGGEGGDAAALDEFRARRARHEAAAAADRLPPAPFAAAADPWEHFRGGGGVVAAPGEEEGGFVGGPGGSAGSGWFASGAAPPPGAVGPPAAGLFAGKAALAADAAKDNRGRSRGESASPPRSLFSSGPGRGDTAGGAGAPSDLFGGGPWAGRGRARGEGWGRPVRLELLQQGNKVGDLFGSAPQDAPAASLFPSFPAPGTAPAGREASLFPDAASPLPAGPRAADEGGLPPDPASPDPSSSLFPPASPAGPDALFPGVRQGLDSGTRHTAGGEPDSLFPGVRQNQEDSGEAVSGEPDSLFPGVSQKEEAVGGEPDSLFPGARQNQEQDSGEAVSGATPDSLFPVVRQGQDPGARRAEEAVGGEPDSLFPPAPGGSLFANSAAPASPPNADGEDGSDKDESDRREEAPFPAAGGALFPPAAAAYSAPASLFSSAPVLPAGGPGSLFATGRKASSSSSSSDDEKPRPKPGGYAAPASLFSSAPPPGQTGSLFASASQPFGGSQAPATLFPPAPAPGGSLFASGNIGGNTKPSTNDDSSSEDEKPKPGGSQAPAPLFPPAPAPGQTGSLFASGNISGNMQPSTNDDSSSEDEKPNPSEKQDPAPLFPPAPAPGQTGSLFASGNISGNMQPSTNDDSSSEDEKPNPSEKQDPAPLFPPAPAPGQSLFASGKISGKMQPSPDDDSSSSSEDEKAKPSEKQAPVPLFPPAPAPDQTGSLFASGNTDGNTKPSTNDSSSEDERPKPSEKQDPAPLFPPASAPGQTGSLFASGNISGTMQPSPDDDSSSSSEDEKPKPSRKQDPAPLFPPAPAPDQVGSLFASGDTGGNAQPSTKDDNSSDGEKPKPSENQAPTASASPPGQPESLFAGGNTGGNAPPSMDDSSSDDEKPKPSGYAAPASLFSSAPAPGPSASLFASASTGETARQAADDSSSSSDEDRRKPRQYNAPASLFSSAPPPSSFSNPGSLFASGNAAAAAATGGQAPASLFSSAPPAATNNAQSTLFGTEQKVADAQNKDDGQAPATLFSSAPPASNGDPSGVQRHEQDKEGSGSGNAGETTQTCMPSEDIQKPSSSETPASLFARTGEIDLAREGGSSDVSPKPSGEVPAAHDSSAPPQQEALFTTTGETGSGDSPKPSSQEAPTLFSSAPPHQEALFPTTATGEKTDGLGGGESGGCALAANGGQAASGDADAPLFPPAHPSPAADETEEVGGGGGDGNGAKSGTRGVVAGLSPRSGDDAVPGGDAGFPPGATAVGGDGEAGKGAPSPPPSFFPSHGTSPESPFAGASTEANAPEHARHDINSDDDAAQRTSFDGAPLGMPALEKLKRFGPAPTSWFVDLSSDKADSDATPAEVPR